MTAMTTVVRVAFTWALYYDQGMSPEGQDRTYQPSGVVLENDGRWSHWMWSGTDYELRHDGIGWVCVPADAGRWMDGHVRRLAEPQGGFVTALPGGDGLPVALDPARVYRLRHDPDGMVLLG